MTLSVTTLQTQFAKLMDPSNKATFAGFPSTSAAAAANYANAYATYAATATDTFGNAVLVAHQSAFQSSLTWAAGTTAAQAAALFGSAFTAYWMGATLALAAIPPGFASATTNVVTAAPSASLVSGLTSAFATQYPTGAAAAAALAAIFHSASTSSIVTLITGVTSVPAPITAPGAIS